MKKTDMGAVSDSVKGGRLSTRGKHNFEAHGKQGLVELPSGGVGIRRERPRSLVIEKGRATVLWALGGGSGEVYALRKKSPDKRQRKSVPLSVLRGTFRQLAGIESHKGEDQ